MTNEERSVFDTHPEIFMLLLALVGLCYPFIRVARWLRSNGLETEVEEQ